MKKKNVSIITYSIRNIHRLQTTIQHHLKKSDKMNLYFPVHSMFFREMSGDPKFDPFHLVKIMPKLDNATDRDQNLIVSAGGQDVMQNFRPLYLCHFRKIPGNPHFTHFKIAPKFGKSTAFDHNLLNYKCGQDTPICKISADSFHAFYGKFPEPPNLTRHTKSK